MTRETSRAAYRTLVESGALKGQQAEILDLVIQHGAGTAAEILRGTVYDRNRNLARARFTELSARGLIVEVAARECKVTGTRALVWEFSGRTKPLSAKRAQRASRKALAGVIGKLCDYLEENGYHTDEMADARALAARA